MGSQSVAELFVQRELLEQPPARLAELPRLWSLPLASLAPVREALVRPLHSSQMSQPPQELP